MTAASSTDQALIQICSCAGSGETRARLATAAPRPTPLGQRRASGPGGRVPGDGVSAALRMVLVIEAPWSEWSVSDARSGPPASRRGNRQASSPGPRPETAAARRSTGSEVERQRGELGAGGDAELGERVPQMKVDGAG